MPKTILVVGRVGWGGVGYVGGYGRVLLCLRLIVFKDYLSVPNGDS